MTLHTTTVTGAFWLSNGMPAAGYNVTFRLTRMESDNGVIVPPVITTITDSSGQLTIDLWPNDRGAFGSQYTVEVRASGAGPHPIIAQFRISVPEDGPHDLHDLIDPDYTPPIVNEVIAARNQTIAARDATEGYRDETADLLEQAKAIVLPEGAGTAAMRNIGSGPSDISRNMDHGSMAYVDWEGFEAYMKAKYGLTEV